MADLIDRNSLNETPDYDAGLLNDFGGGNVEWWQDYLRAEIGRANEFWRDAIAALPAQGVQSEAIKDALASLDMARDALEAALAPAEAGGVEEPISDSRLECEALCARFLAGEASEKEVVDTIRRIARANERLAVLAGKHKEQMRPETDMEHIARDMREGRFPERSEPQMVPVTPAPVDALVKAEMAEARRIYSGFGHCQEALRYAESMVLAALTAYRGDAK